MEGLENGWLDVLADVALHQAEFEEHEEDQSEEAAQRMEEEEKVAHDHQSSGEIWPLSEDASNGVHHHYAHCLKHLGIQALLLPCNTVVSNIYRCTEPYLLPGHLADWCKDTYRFMRRTSRVVTTECALA